MAPSTVNSSPFSRASLPLIGLAWTLPFLQPYHSFPLTSFYSEWLAFALGLAAALPLLRRQTWREATIPIIALVPAGMVVVLFVQVALDRVPYAEQALMAGLYLLWAGLLVLLGHALRREIPLERITVVLAWFLLGGGLLNALIGLAQHYHLATPLDFLIARRSGPVIYGNLGQPNHYAACVSLALASAAYLYSRRSLHGAFAAGGAALLLMALALSGSRSSWLYIAATIALALGVHRQQRSDTSRRLVLFAAWLLPGFVAAQVLVTAPFMLPTAGTPPLTSADRLFQVAGGIEPRLQLWGEAWQMFLGAPVLGAGFGSFAWHHFLHQATSGATAAPGVFNHSHNVILQLLAETGVVGALLVVAALFAWAVDLCKVRLDPPWWWLLALLAVVGIHSMLEYPLWYAYFLGMAALALGLGAQGLLAVRLAGTARLAVSAIVLVGVVNLVAVIPPYRDFERLVFSTGRNKPAVDEREFAASLMQAYREPLLTPYVELAFALAAPVNPVQLREKLDLATRAMHFAPLDIVVYRRAFLLALAGEREAALAQLEQALRVYPGEAAAIVSELEDGAHRHPDELTPLLELASAKLGKRRAPREGS